MFKIVGDTVVLIVLEHTHGPVAPSVRVAILEHCYSAFTEPSIVSLSTTFLCIERAHNNAAV